MIFNLAGSILPYRLIENQKPEPGGSGISCPVLSVVGAIFKQVLKAASGLPGPGNCSIIDCSISGCFIMVP